MFQQYENDFLFRIKLPNGTFIYRLEEDEADAVKEAIRRKRPIPPPKYKRLIPFGEGVEVIGHRIDCRYKGAHLGVFSDLKKARTAWDVAERYERFCMEKEAEQTAIDKRYYGDLTFDEHGYKVFKPQPSVP